MLDLSWWIAALALFAGCCIQTAVGFGMALVAAPVIVIVRPEWVPVVLTFTALILSSGNSWQLWRRIDWTSIWPAVVTRVPGTVVGAWLLTRISSESLQLFVAISVLLAVLVSAFGRPFRYTPQRMGLAGFVSGVMGTTTSIGGPPLALVMQHGAPDAVRANLAAYFTFSSAIALLSYYTIDRLDATITLHSLSFTPFIALGLWAGRRLQLRADRNYRPIVLLMCSLSAMLAMYAALR